MKRNRPPDGEEDCRDEAQQIRDRLEEIFSHCQPSQRQIALCNHGIWIEDQRHVRVEPTVRVTPADMVKHSHQLGYRYLNPYEALFCLDSNQLIIYFKNLPLSLSEAYQLMLANELQHREYRVFQQLTRTGHICLEPSVAQYPARDEVTATSSSTVLQDTKQELPGSSVSELFSIDSIKMPLNDVLAELQKLGPQALHSKPHKRNSDLKLTFDVYKREGFAKNKPRGDHPGSPDYHLIVCDATHDNPPGSNELFSFSKATNIASNKLLFALLDHDSSIFFAQYNELETTDNSHESHPGRLNEAEQLHDWRW